jgi:tRNA A22 N-methylase
VRSSPISLAEVEQNIIRLVEELEEHTEAFEVLAVDQAKKEARYKSSWAKEYLAANGSIKERESWADYKLSDEYYEVKIADALLKAKKEKLNSLRTSLDSLRTLAANVRAQT